MLYQEPNAVQIRVTLSEIEPTVWRRLVVPLTWNLSDLHLVIQAAFNWRNYHLHEFDIGGLHYGDPETLDDACDEDPRSFDERGVRLLDFQGGTGAVFGYQYDFGDRWRHVVELEQYLVFDVAPKVASCIAGARARPPEDVGGADAYQRFLAIMSDWSDPEYAETKRWCGGYFDPEWFDLEIADKDVKNALKPNVRRRLYQPKPKRASA